MELKNKGNMKNELPEKIKRQQITIKLPPSMVKDLRQIFSITDGEYFYYTQFIEKAVNEKLEKYLEGEER